MSETAAQKLSAVITALAHPARRRLLAVLHERGPLSAGDLADGLECAWPTTTRHLQVLAEAGLVTVEQIGRTRLYRMEAAPLQMAAAFLKNFNEETDIKQA